MSDKSIEEASGKLVSLIIKYNNAVDEVATKRITVTTLNDQIGRALSTQGATAVAIEKLLEGVGCGSDRTYGAGARQLHLLSDMYRQILSPRAMPAPHPGSLPSVAPASGKAPWES